MEDNYNRVGKFGQITTEMFELYKRKNKDYGNSVAKTFDEWGLVSFLIRMEDKMNRVINLTKNKGVAQVSDEKIEDTLLDLANYSIMALIEMDRAKQELTSNKISVE